MRPIECFVDPACPWSWTTSAWIRVVQDAAGLRVRWRFLSLSLLDRAAGRPRPAHIEAIHGRGHEHLLVLAAVRRLAGEDAAERALHAVTTATWGTDPASDEAVDDAAASHTLRTWAARRLDLGGLLASVDVDPTIVDAVADEDHRTVADETAAAVQRVGPGLGTPVVTFGPPDGPSFFGPVVTATPADPDEAVERWRALETLAGTGGLAELRTRRPPLPDLPQLRGLERGPEQEPATGPEAATRRPTMLAAVADPAARRTLATALERRFGADYHVVVHSRAGDAAARLPDLGDVAVALAPIGGAEFPLLAAVRAHDLTTRRIAIVEVGDRSVADELSAALTLGLVDYYVGQPWASPEEELYPVIGESLRTWSIDRGDQYDKAVIVDDGGEGRELLSLLERNGVAARLHDASSPEGGRLRDGPLAGLQLPAIELWDGRTLGAPSPTELATALGANTRPRHQRYDVAIVGGGPAGLAAAVYAASEGLRATMVEEHAIGGQAGTSTRIRNYLGFPWGVRGGDLARLANRQAEQFGVEEIVTHRAVGLTVDGDDRIVQLSSGDEVRTACVVLAGGVAYRRLGVASVDDLVGRGVFYGAGASEAAAMRGRHVFVLGGGNSAGQAAAHLAESGATVEILLRGDALARSMSDYLVNQLAGLDAVAVRRNVTVTGGLGDQQLTGLRLTDTTTGTVCDVAGDALFVFIGARPHTDWLDGTVRLDDRGFVLTGLDGARWLETSVPRVFAAGDIRSGSIKRVAAAVGEGSCASMLARETIATHA